MKTYSEERKSAVVQKLLPPLCVPIAQLARQEGIARATLYAWRKQASEESPVLLGLPHQGAAWSAQARLAAVIETATLSAIEVAAYCREKGLYSEQIKAWRLAFLASPTREGNSHSGHAAQHRADKKRIGELERELRRKDKALAETAALLVLRKKYQTLWDQDAEVK